MSNSHKKGSAQPAESKSTPEPGAFIDDEVVHVPKGKSPLQFYLVPATSEILLRKLGLTVELNFP